MQPRSRQPIGHAAPVGSARSTPAPRLAFGLRAILAAATVVVTLGVLVQDPPRVEMRWVLAFLATALFAVSTVEGEIILKPGRGRLSDDESIRDAEAKIRQLTAHRTDYISTMSHELRTPLTSIRGFAQLLARDGATPEPARVQADMIVQEADRLARIVDDIVDLTRMESKVLQLRREPVPIGDLLRDVVAWLTPAHAPRQIQLDLPARLPLIRGDRALLEQLLGRLILDAISRSSPQKPLRISAEAGERAVAISLEYAAAPEQAVRMPRALESLWQSESDCAATRLGRGELGPYIARHLIEAHGGRMWIQADPKGEIRVLMSLPC